MKKQGRLSTKSLVTGAFAFLASATLVSTAQAAPLPATASSKLVSPQLGIYRSPLGFMVSAGDSGWVQLEAPKESKYIATLYKAPATGEAPKAAGKGDAKGDKSATLTVRVDKLEKEMPLDKYVQKWMKEYPKYGFDVLSSKPFTQNKQRGYVLDLLNRDSQRQLRQVVFLKKAQAVILTCRDGATTFKDSLKGCNTIIRSFNWAE